MGPGYYMFQWGTILDGTWILYVPGGHNTKRDLDITRSSGAQYWTGPGYYMFQGGTGEGILRRKYLPKIRTFKKFGRFFLTDGQTDRQTVTHFQKSAKFKFRPLKCFFLY